MAHRRDFRISSFWILLCVMTFVVVQADIGVVHITLKYHLQWCLSMSRSMHAALAHLLHCITSSVYQCLLFQEPSEIYTPIETRGICGVINSGQGLKPYQWYLTVHSKFSISIDFLYFHLPCSLHCRQTYVLIDVPLLFVYEMWSNFKYCGHRVPWNLSFPQSQVNVKFSTEQELERGFYFVMTFEAFDIRLPSVGYVHVSEHEGKIHENYVSVKRNIVFSLFKTEFRIYFLATVVNRIILKYPMSPISKRDGRELPDFKYLLSDVRVYDGPGILSSLIVPKCNESTQYCTCYLMSYQGLLKYTVSRPSNFEAGYIKLPHHRLTKQGIIWTNKAVLESSEDCIQQGKSIRFHSKSGYCWGQPYHSLIAIHQMTFTGYDMLQSRLPCTYGGLFIILYNSFITPGYDNNFITICLSVHSEIVLPYRVNSRSDRMVIIFKTFEGYSDGSVDLTISQDPECVGMNYIGETGLWCINYYWWTDWKDKGDKRPESEQCTEYWLIHYAIHPLKPTELEQCTFPIKPPKPRRTVGSFKFMVSGSVVSQHQSSFIALQENTYFTMKIEADTVMDFPANLSTESVNSTLKLPTSSRRTFLFKPENNLHVKLNYTGELQQLMLVIRMQIFENVICPSFEGYNILEMSQIYTLPSTVSDVYLSRLYPYNGYIIKFMKYTGYNRGSCRVLVKGQACSQKNSYKVINIFYRPNMILEAAHKIQISMKRTPYCSFKCPLDITICEIITVNNATRLRCDEWRGIYHLTWQLIAASYHGFSVHINATCTEDSCAAKLCDVAVAFSVLLQWKIVYNGPKTFNHYEVVQKDEQHLLDNTITDKNMYETSKTDVVPQNPAQLSPLVHGSWYNVSEYCLAKNLSLGTFTPSVREKIRYTLNMQYLEYGWDQSELYIFAGLHRDDMVRFW